jgi:multicomponent Na+:H+ antiporter subunit D
MYEPLLELLATVNPGVFMMMAGGLAVFVRGTPLRVLALLGGPALALFAMLQPAPWTEPLATASMFGNELVLFRIDSLSFVFGLGFVLAAALAGIYALHRTAPLQDAMSLVYAGAAVGAVFSGDLLTLFVFWEIAGLSSAVLVFAGGDEDALGAGMRYLLFQLASGLLLLGGAAWLAAEGAPTTFAGLAPLGQHPLLGVLDLSTPAGALIFCALGIKAAFPLAHTWVTDAYPRASETGTVVLSLFTTKLAVYALLRCFTGTEVLVWIGALMAVLPALLMLHEGNLRRVLSYSLICQVGFMVCAVGVGTPLAVNGAVAHAFTSIAYQTLLFMALGAVVYRTGTDQEPSLGGLYRTMPLTALACLVGALSIAAAPGSSGFTGKSMTVSGVEGQELLGPWLLLLAASAATVVQVAIRIPASVFFGADRGLRPSEAPFNMLFAMGIAGFVAVIAGLGPAWLYDILPFPDEAMEYLRNYFWKPSHVLLQLELVLFAALAFVVLKQRGWLPDAPQGAVRDTGWVASRLVSGPGQTLWSAGGRLLGMIWRGVSTVAAALQEDARQFFSHGKLMSLKFPLDSTTIWTVVVLGCVLIVALYA